jgi:hypothetical protein
LPITATDYSPLMDLASPAAVRGGGGGYFPGWAVKCVFTVQTSYSQSEVVFLQKRFAACVVLQLLKGRASLLFYETVKTVSRNCTYLDCFSNQVHSGGGAGGKKLCIGIFCSIHTLKY